MATTVTITKEMDNPRARVRILEAKGDPNPKARTTITSEGVTTHLGDSLKTRVTVYGEPEAAGVQDPLNTRVTLLEPTIGGHEQIKMDLPEGAPPPAQHVLAEMRSRVATLTEHKKAIEAELRDLTRAIRLAETIEKRVPVKVEPPPEPPPALKQASPGPPPPPPPPAKATPEPPPPIEVSAEVEITIPSSHRAATRDQLLELATKLELEIAEDATKSQIYDAIVEATEESEE